MKKLQMEATYKEVKEVAIQLGIKYVGVKRENIIQAVNAKIDETTTTKKTSKLSKTLADYSLEEGQIVKISGFEVKGKMILVNREVMITRSSRAKGYIKGRLINPENGEAQKTEIAITTDIIIQGSNLPSTFVVA